MSLSLVVTQSTWDRAFFVPVAYLAGVVLVAGIGLAILSAIRRKVAGSPGEPDSGFSLSTARELRNQGLVTEKEYAQIKQRILDSVPARDSAGNAQRR